MAISAAQLEVSFRSSGAEQVAGEIDAIDGKVQQATGGFDEFFDSIQGGAGDALRALDGISQAMGAIAVMGGVKLLAGGARDAFNQVSAIEQATFAMSAYGDSATEVQDVLNDLTNYAQDASRSGGIFWSEDLYSAAQQLIIVGVELENVSEYVQIMSRAVGLGTVSFDELARVLQRVGAAGRITGTDFDMLRQWGFQLDEQLRNTNITWEELFDNLDRGIPADALLGQADTIQGAFLYLRGAIIDVGQEFLGITEDMEFAAGSLGERIVEGLQAAPDAIRAFGDAAADLGNIIVGIVDSIQSLVAAYQSLPDPIRTVLELTLQVIAAFGALRVAGRALGMISGLAGMGGMVGGIQGMMGAFATAGGGAIGFRAALAGLVTSINPVTIAVIGVTAAVGALAIAWGKSRREAEEQAQAIATLKDAYLDLHVARDQALLAGNEQAAMNIDQLRFQVESVRAEADAIYSAASSSGMVLTEIRDGYKITGDQAESLAESQQRLTAAFNDSSIDGAALAADIDALYWSFMRGDITLADFVFRLDDLSTNTARYRIEIDGATESTSRFADILGFVNTEAQGFVDTIMSLNTISDDDSFFDRMLKAFGTSAGDRAGISSFLNEITQGYTALDDMPGPDADHAEWMEWVNEAEYGTAAWKMRVDEATAALNAQQEAIVDVTQVTSGMLSVLGQGDLTSMLNLAGLGGDAVTAAANVNELSASMDTLFRVVVGNTDAIGSQFQRLFDWADDLIAEEGVWSKLDDLLVAGRISGEHGVFTGDSEYARAQQAYNSILEDNAAIQEHILTIQAKQAPLLAANASAMEEYMGAIADMPVDEQLAALGFMDAGLQSQLGTVIELGGQFKTLGPEGEDAFRAMADGIALTNPALFAMMEQIGLVTDVVRSEDGTVLSYEVNLDGATTVQDSLDDLIESIDALTLALGGIPPVRVDTSEIDPAIEKLNALADATRNAVQAGLGNIGAGGNNSARTGSRDAGGPETHGDTGVPVVTGLPNTGTGGTVTVDADTSSAHTVLSLLEDRLNALEDRVTTITIDADASASVDPLNEVIRVHNELNQNDVTVTVLADTESAMDDIGGVETALDDIDGASAIVYLHAIDFATSTINSVSQSLALLDGSSATVSVGVGFSGFDFPGFADGGVVNTPLAWVGERGPELVSLPKGSYVHTNAESMRIASSSGDKGGGSSGKSVNVDMSGMFSGATFNNTSREEMNQWASEEFTPALERALTDRRTGMGVA